MKTNTFFSWSRFVALIRQDLLLNRIQYLLTLAVCVGAIYLGLVFQMSQEPFGFIERVNSFYISRMNGWGYGDYFVFTLLGLAVIIGLGFSNLNSKPKVTRMLMLPASTFEKYLYPFLIRVVFGLGLFILIFWVDARLAGLTMQGSEQYVLNKYVLVPFQFNMLLDVAPKSPDNILLLVALLTSGVFAFAVPLFFKKQALLKTVLAYFAVIFAYYCCMVFFSHLFIPGSKGFYITLDEYQINDQLSNILVLFLLLLNLLWPSLLVIGYFKLKEKRL